MKISQILQEATRPFPSIEIVPPLKGISREELLDSIRPFMEFNLPYINVTSHRDEIEFVEKPDGSFEKRTVQRRISETAVCSAILSEFKIEVVPHLICAGADKEAIESQIRDFKFLGINNILALRGDCMTSERRFTPTPGGYAYANELVSAISANHPGEFCVGVGAYPEKHFEAANLDTDIAYLKRKVDAGAEFIITQMFFDNSVFYSFVKKCREAGISVPIIPGLKPLSSAKQILTLPEAFSIDIPLELTKEVEKYASDRDAVYTIGQQWCKQQCRDLLSHGCPSVHFYTMGKSANVTGILKECF